MWAVSKSSSSVEAMHVSADMSWLGDPRLAGGSKAGMEGLLYRVLCDFQDKPCVVMLVTIRTSRRGATGWS